METYDHATITFDGSLGDATLTLTEGELSITADVTLLIDGDIDDDGEIDITIDANDE